VLGLFLYTLLPLGADEDVSLSAGGGTLWIGDDGGSGYWRSGLSFRTENNFYADVSLGQVVSSLPWADGSVFGSRWTAGYNTPLVGFEFSSGIFLHSYISSDTESFSFYNDRGSGSFFSLKAPLHIGVLTIEPSALYGGGSWDAGSFYWFFGKPSIPSISILGLALSYRAHALNFHYLSLEAGILSNEEVKLFDAHMNAYSLYYRFSMKTTKLGFNGSLGWLYASADVNGALTSLNQSFSLFPYVFYNVNGFLNAHAGFGAISVEHAVSIFKYHITLGALHFFRAEGAAKIHYKNKQLFSGEEAFETMPLNAEGAGAAFMLLDAGIPALQIGGAKKLHLSLGIPKLFAIPWGYENFLADGELGGGTASLLKTLLLSGLSFSCSLKF
jgi:hypothetical protein